MFVRRLLCDWPSFPSKFPTSGFTGCDADLAEKQLEKPPLQTRQILCVAGSFSTMKFFQNYAAQIKANAGSRNIVF